MKKKAKISGTSKNSFTAAANKKEKKVSKNLQNSQFTKVDLDKEFKKSQTEQCSSIIMGIWGRDGTGKSGIAMDFRTKKERKEGKKLIFFELDKTNKPLRKTYHNNDPNIILLSPWEYIDGKVNYSLTYSKLIAWIDYIRLEIDPKEVAAIVFDTCDGLLEISQHAVSEEWERKYNQRPKTKDDMIQFWGFRNIKYYSAVKAFDKLSCAKLYLAHPKEKVNFKNGMEYETVDDPKWHNKHADDFYQKVKMTKEINIKKGIKTIIFYAEIEKSTTNIELEGKKIPVARVRQRGNETLEAEWRGLFSRIRDKI